MSIRTAAQPPHGTARVGVVLRTAAATWYQDGPDAPLLRIPTGSALAPGSAPRPDAPPEGAPAAVLFDRDGTLIEDVPHNTDPARVRARPHAAEAMRLLEAAGTRAAVVTNQPDIGRGLLTLAQLEALHARMAELLGPIEVTAVCPHIPGAGCGCRKPAPGLVHAVCRVLGLPPARTVVVGDIGTDLLAAHHAGAPGLLVPNEATRPEETDAAPRTAGHLASAVRILLGPAHGPDDTRAHTRSRPGGLG
ncbi:HAD-IIIA family hydrolase [Streptomyces tubbatahanensis]|uniref:D,D-heptose 1,7-bisphosphate phosphatase n=1 Tax=Streptomyces tubbatahanensis TaxID=2923272 RepID=A0ABY3XRM3_9ACTN|nr:HAD-IIIA family hydrolase [Streptomyces tubbatahanensis]UNS97069.1 HAD-IIIA family hydrolase [Streptomyces tubbatahanensis]